MPSSDRSGATNAPVPARPVPAPATPPSAAPGPAAPAVAAPAPARIPEKSKAAASLLAPEQLHRLEGYNAGRNPLLRERLAAARDKLASEPDGSYSIELFVAENSDAARMERFLLRARELVPLAQVYVIPVVAGSRYLIRVVYGVYPGKQASVEDAKRLPPKYQNAFAFQPRSFAELRAAL
jgi:septal ring-binding cell division protein DamX